MGWCSSLHSSTFFAPSVEFADKATVLYEVMQGIEFMKKHRHGEIMFILDWKNQWGADPHETLTEFNQVLIEPNVLVAPDRGVSKRVATDYSSYGLVVVPLWSHGKVQWCPIWFSTRTMHKSKIMHQRKGNVWLSFLNSKKDITPFTESLST